MPRENRKRGKKHKKPKELASATGPEQYDETQHPHRHPQAGPSWIIDRNPDSAYDDGNYGEGAGSNLDLEANPDAPFGYVDPDVKAYFRTVDTKLREWQEQESGAPYSRRMQDGDEDLGEVNEERRLFLVAALSELSGKEKQLATDPDCSNILERMAFSMDDFVKRVLFDRLAGSYEQLARHRFGSHVVQTLLSVAKDTIRREAKGQIALPPDGDTGDENETEGVLPSLTQLVLDLANELLPRVSELLMDPFASHVLRALFVLLCPALNSDTDSASSDTQGSLLRSKKSAKHRAKQGPMRSVFVNENDGAEVREKGKEREKGGKGMDVYPVEFADIARRVVETVRGEMSANEIRALAASKVACPVLVLLLELESLQNDSNKAGSLMDSVSAGLITWCLESHEQKPESSDFVATLLRDPASSRLLEALITLLPPHAFEVLWELYFEGKLARLAVHPVSNFVVARAIARLNENRLSAALVELEGTWPKFVKNTRLGVLKAFVDHSVNVTAVCKSVLDAVNSAFGLHVENAGKGLVMCALHIKSFTDYYGSSKEANDEGEPALPAFEPNVQGSLLLQSLLNLPEPQNTIITSGILSLPIAQLLLLAQHPISSRIIDVFLESPSVPARARRRLILTFQNHFPALVHDRVGSRVGERLWNAADPYLKEKVARAMLPHEASLVGSRYGKYFVRGLDLYLLKRDPEAWKNKMVKSSERGEVRQNTVTVVPITAAPASAVVDSANREENGSDKKKRKRKEKNEDEIDALFNSALGKKQKKANIAPEVPPAAAAVDEEKVVEKEKKKSLDDIRRTDKDLAAVLGAIQNAPKEEKSGKAKKAKKK